MFGQLDDSAKRLTPPNSQPGPGVFQSQALNSDNHYNSSGRRANRVENRLSNQINRIKEESEVTPEMIIDMLMKEAESTPQEDYDDVYDLMQDVFSPVEDKLEDMGFDIDDLRMEYDDILMGQWER